MQLLSALQCSDDARDDVVIATLHAVVVTWHAAVSESINDRFLERLEVVNVREEEEEERDNSGVLDEKLAVCFEGGVKYLGREMRETVMQQNLKNKRLKARLHSIQHSITARHLRDI